MPGARANYPKEVAQPKAARPIGRPGPRWSDTRVLLRATLRVGYAECGRNARAVNAKRPCEWLPDTLPGQQQFRGRPKVIDHTVEESAGGRAVNQPVVVGETQRHYQPRHDLPLAHRRQPARTAQ